jgi:hypothetical protein
MNNQPKITPAISRATQAPKNPHMCVIFIPPVVTTQRIPSQCGAVAMNGEIMNPIKVEGVQYFT